MTDPNDPDFSEEAMASGPVAEDSLIVQGCACGKPRHRFYFDEFNHSYWMDDKEVPGVTKITERCGMTKEFNDVAMLAAKAGTNQHKIIEIYDKGQIDHYEIDEDGAHKLEQWREMREALRIEKYEAIEVSGLGYYRHPSMDVGIHWGGTGDRLYIAGPNHPKWPEGTKVYQDAKTAKDPKPSKLYRKKSALYSLIFGCEGRELVYLTPTGRFSPLPLSKGGSMDYHDDPLDIEAAKWTLADLCWRSRRTRSEA